VYYEQCSKKKKRFLKATTKSLGHDYQTGTTTVGSK
jgi:hypothetical protein